MHIMLFMLVAGGVVKHFVHNRQFINRVRKRRFRTRGCD